MQSYKLLYVVGLWCFMPVSRSQNRNVFAPYLWNEIDYLYPNESARLEAINRGQFIPQNVLINDVDAWDDPVRGKLTAGKRIFVSTPRFKSGTPAVVSEVTDVKSGDIYKLAPFPNWSMHELTEECSTIVSVDKMHIDSCGLLWLVDTGKVDEFVAPRQVCPPKLLIYDLANNDQLIETYVFPKNVLTGGGSGTTLTTIVTESKANNCLDSVAYIGDIRGSGLVVFDLQSKTSWRVNHNYFYPDPRYGTFNISGVTFDLMDGVFAMALSPISRTGDRALFFHSLASVRESWVPTSVLKNTSLVSQPDLLRPFFSLSDEFRDGQSSLEVMTDNGILIYSVLSRNALACWNTVNAPVKNNTFLLYQSDEDFQFISGMKLKGDVLWIASNRVQYEFSPNATSANTSYRMRIVVIKSVAELLKNSECQRISKSLGSRRSSSPSLNTRRLSRPADSPSKR